MLNARATGTLLTMALAAAAQTFTPETLPTGDLLREPGPTFRVDIPVSTEPFTVIAYGDQRFTDPSNVDATDPRVRQYLVKQIAMAHPEAVVLNGDVPLAGSRRNDYYVYLRETKPWRDAQLRVYPALGNHEFVGDPREALDHWWSTFPELRNRRWYSVHLGARIYLLMLDSAASLLPGSDQARWIENQIDDLPASVDFLIVSIHHPPVADIQTHILLDHNPRPNEIALRDYLAKAAAKSHARILVSAGHIHNYERNERDGIVYLVSGGGGAKPYYVERTAEDQFKSVFFPNFHYIKLTLEQDRLRGEMYRVTDPEAQTLTVEIKDRFELRVKR